LVPVPCDRQPSGRGDGRAMLVGVVSPHRRPTAEQDDRSSEPLTVDLRDPAFWQDPYPVWRAARAQHRTARTTPGEVVLLDAADLDAAGGDPAFAPLGLDALHRPGITDGPSHEWRRLTLAALDGEHHQR